MKQLFIILLVLPLMAMSQTFEKKMFSMTEFTVKQGHTAQFMEGVKKWKECYNENEGTNSWGFWSRVQGENNVYGVTGYMPNWADMDKEDMAGKSCRMLAMTFIVPHVEKSHYSISKTLPDWSKKTLATDVKLVWATYFKVKNGALFSEIIKEVTATIAAEEGEARGYWYSFMGGGEDDPNYMVTDLFSSYAAIDEDDKKDGPFALYKKVHGDKKAKQMMEKWSMAVGGSWSYIWEFNEELSN